MTMMEDVNKEIGKRIRGLREKQGVESRGLAEEVWGFIVRTWAKLNEGSWT